MSSSASQHIPSFPRCTVINGNLWKKVQEAVQAHSLPQLQGDKQFIEGLCKKVDIDDMR